MSGTIRRIRALLLRYLLLVRRDPSRVVDLVYWPFIDIAIWGLLTVFVAQAGLPNVLGIFLGGAILWNVFLRASQDVSVSFLDDVWARSLVTLFASPLTFVEFGVALTVVGFVKVVLALVFMSAIAWLLYAFDLFTLGWALLPFAANLIVFGWTLGLVSLAIVLRWGGRWAILAWSIPFTMMPISSVFYPERVLPPAVRAVARAIPANHVFEGMRAVLIEKRMAWDRVAIATVENAVYLALAAALVAWTFRVALTRGLLPKVR
ncbi:MAG TPA: ABC transporter permease [Candidatus Binatia bacterium]|nr:ABC transporter permease [Candidatus Binatia bacterium]